MKVRTWVLVGVAGVAFGAVLCVVVWYRWDRIEYAPGYSEKTFLSVTPGMSDAQVRALLGQPLAERRDPMPETWDYSKEKPMTCRWFRCVMLLSDVDRVVFGTDGLVVAAFGRPSKTVAAGMSRDQVRQLEGMPTEIFPASTFVWYYSRQAAEFGRTRVRGVVFDGSSHVVSTFAYDDWD